MTVFSAAPYQNVLLLLFQISVLLFMARLCGAVARRYGQPVVVGELLAGILVGPSVLGLIFPSFKILLVPATPLQGHLLEVVSMMGALFLLLITGMETDLRLIKRHLKTAIGMSFSGLVLTFVTGYFLGQSLPDSLLVDPSQRMIFSLFLATALSIAAIPVIAKVLIDMNLLRREIGQTILAAGMCDDTVGWILLSMVTGLASGAGVSFLSVGKTVGSVVVFLGVSLTLGKWLAKKMVVSLQNRGATSNDVLGLVVFLMFCWSTITQALHLEALFGAFVMGIILGQIRQLPTDIHQKIESLTLGFFAPVFFAVAGLKVNIANLFEPGLFLIGLLVIGVASFGKMVGAFTGARVFGKKDGWTAFTLAAGLNARGAMEIIVATIGLSLGILSQDMFTVIVVMAMVTSLMAPTLLRWSIRHIKVDVAEEERIAEEDRLKASLVAGIRRVLLPVRFKSGGEGHLQSLEAQLLGFIGQKNKIAITLFSVARTSEKAAHQAYLTALSKWFTGVSVDCKVVESEHLADVILDESHKNYDLMILGATELDERTDILFTPLVDYLVRTAPCPTLVVKGVALSEHRDMTRILLPSSGSGASRHSADLAFQIAGDKRHVTALHVVVQGDGNWAYGDQDNHLQREHEISREITHEVAKLGQKLGVNTDAVSLAGKNPEEVILNYARQNRMDLIVLGTNLRPGSDKLFLGPRVERILNNTPCPVLVFNTM